MTTAFLRYPTTDRICASCGTRAAMFNSELCGYCDEENPRIIVRNRTECFRCKAPHGAWIQRSLTNPQNWIKAESGSSDTPGYNDARRATVLSNGLCRWCADKMREG